MAPIFEHPDRVNIERAYDTFSATADGYQVETVKKIVQAPAVEDEAKSSDVKVETK